MRHICALLSILLTSCYTLAQQTPVPTAHHVVGRCNDVGTGLGLKASIYAIVNEKKQKLGECRDVGKFEAMTGTFDVMLPVKASHLVLEMRGYRTVTVPVYFTPGGIPAQASFSIWNWGDMTSVDSLPKQASFMDQVLSLYFDVPDKSILPATYRITDEQNGSRRTTFRVMDHSANKPHSTAATVGLHSDSLTTRDGRFISTGRFVTRPGITFRSVRVAMPVQDIVAPTIKAGDTLTIRANVPRQANVPKPANVPEPAASNVPTPVRSAPTVATVYFDQSSPDLRPQAKTTLDSVARVLAQSPALRATITGYTDNVGQRDLNVTLSEYRARAVATYLRRRGVSLDQLITNGKGPDATVTTDASEAAKIRSRRVVIQIM